MPWRRRNFLGALLLFLSAPSIVKSTRAPERLPVAAIVLLRTLHDLAAAKVIGDAYLTKHPEERNPRILVRALMTQSGIRTADLVTKGQAQSLLQRKRHFDFTAGDTVVLDGWILGRSECRLCALAALA